MQREASLCLYHAIVSATFRYWKDSEYLAICVILMLPDCSQWARA